MLPGVGVFGTGEIANVLIPLLREKGFDVRAVWGRTIKEAKETATVQNVPFHTNVIDEMLLHKDVDLVFIVCQPFLHAEISVKALGIGKHVVCDKPAGLHQVDALKMVRASQYYPSLISLINHPLRFLPAFTHMRRCLQEELIGPIADVLLVDVRVQMGTLFPEKFNWMCDAAMGGGALNLVGSVVDLVSFLLQQQAIRVHGVLKSYTKTTASINGIRQITAPDFCNFQMELASGTLVTVALHSHTVPAKAFSQEVLVYGSKGHLVVRGGDLFVLKHDNDGLQKEEALYVDVQDLHFSTTNSLLPRPYIKGLCKMVGALKEAFGSKEASWVKAPVSTAATFEDGLYVQAVIESIRKSNETRQWQRVQITTDTPLNHEQLLRYARLSTM
ncbi:glucose-fructose oxidoreductase domain-containing protein 1 [Scaptodrosophila lebanonensis]|uniref:Glucose-fructose oxidoreductase domain-containing protein 1 n=1 Tax=Drosophila lebanonensis TaxID=7225 RepID=A0A6J2U6W4_DROLE|nr:glucose-fructose oxidoreductase domain-containing protein 1 [Scaptodrosophila lebanonensis]